MNVTEIQNAVNDIRKAMTAKGLQKAQAQVCLESDKEPHVYLSYEALNKKGAYGSQNDYKFIRADSLEQALQDARDFVATFPSPEERKMDEFMQSLAETIELGKEHGIDVQYVNPLIEAMKRLSENAITHQK